MCQNHSLLFMLMYQFISNIFQIYKPFTYGSFHIFYFTTYSPYFLPSTFHYYGLWPILYYLYSRVTSALLPLISFGPFTDLWAKKLSRVSGPQNTCHATLVSFFFDSIIIISLQISHDKHYKPKVLISIKLQLKLLPSFT